MAPSRPHPSRAAPLRLPSLARPLPLATRLSATGPVGEREPRRTSRPRRTLAPVATPTKGGLRLPPRCGSWCVDPAWGAPGTG
eukprot:4883834-Alexandrium_andersonii.AAC.1